MLHCLTKSQATQASSDHGFVGQVNFVVMNKVGGMLQRVDYVRKVRSCSQTFCPSCFDSCLSLLLTGLKRQLLTYAPAPAVRLRGHVHPEEREGRVPHPVRIVYWYIRIWLTLR